MCQVDARATTHDLPRSDPPNPIHPTNRLSSSRLTGVPSGFAQKNPASWSDDLPKPGALVHVARAEKLRGASRNIRMLRLQMLDEVLPPRDLTVLRFTEVFEHHVRRQAPAVPVLLAEVRRNGCRRIDEDLRGDAVEESLNPAGVRGMVEDVQIEISVLVCGAANDRSGRDDPDRIQLLNDEVDGVSEGP